MELLYVSGAGSVADCFKQGMLNSIPDYKKYDEVFLIT
jgi:hypothetical protein